MRALPLLTKLCLASFLFSTACAGTLEEDFANPPIKTRPYVWWHWMGSNFSKEGITKDLEAMKQAGIGGATIFNITSGVQESQAPIANNPWPEQTYRSPAYWEAMAHASAEAQRLGLEIGLHNTVGYSTTGGPWITQERGMQRVVWSETKVTGGTQQETLLPPPTIPSYRGWGGGIKEPLTFYRDIAVLAVPAEGTLTPASVLNLSAKMDSTGKLVWKAPAGSWNVYRFGHAPTGATPHPVPDDVIGQALEADKMSLEQSRFHWQQVLDPLKKHCGAHLGKSFGHVLIDSYEAGNQNWTPGFREAFRKMKGYDPVPWLVSLNQVLTGDKENKLRRLIGTEEETARFEYDYKEVVAELYRLNGWEPAAKLIREAGLTLQFEAYGGPFDVVAGSALADLPMGEFWNHTKGGISGAIVAAGRAAGRRVIGAEAFTGLPQNSRWDETPARLRLSADGSFSGGVNRLILHHWVHQPFADRYEPGFGMGWWGVHFNRQQTWAEPGREFFAYLGRTQALLQRGETPVDVLYVARAEGGADVIAPHMVEQLKVENRRFVLPSGRRYQVLVWNHGGALLPAQAKRLGDLVKAGGVVVAAKPERSPSLQNYPACDVELKQLASTIWGESSGKVISLGAGQLYPTPDPRQALRDLGLDQPIFQGSGDTQDIRFTHRHDEAAKAEIFFVASMREKPANLTASFRVKGLLPELWDAEDGSRRPAPNWRFKEGRTEVDLAFNPADAIFVIFRQPTTETASRTPASSEVTSMPVNGAWQVSFAPGQVAPAKITFPQLTSWSEHSDPAIKYYSGTATYRTTFKLEPAQVAKGQTLRLDLGEVKDLAAVRLNGQMLRVLWCPPYEIEITAAAKPGDNLLEIAVTNTWHNRLIGDEQEPADVLWGKERTFGKEKSMVGRPLAEFPEWFLKNQPRPSTNRHCFVTWNYFTKDSPLLPAGLLGPVILKSSR